MTMYKYLIITNENKPFFTNYFDYENNFNDEINMVVFDLFHHIYTTDGINWKEIEEDHL